MNKTAKKVVLISFVACFAGVANVVLAQIATPGSILSSTCTGACAEFVQANKADIPMFELKSIADSCKEYFKRGIAEDQGVFGQNINISIGPGGGRPLPYGVPYVTPTVVAPPPVATSGISGQTQQNQNPSLQPTAGAQGTTGSTGSAGGTNIFQ